MQDRIAFTAQFWGEHSAVVCRALENHPGPLVDQQFGRFATWTQASAFAAKLNEGLDIDLEQARQIVTSASLLASLVVRAGAVPHPTQPTAVTLRSAMESELRFALSETSLGLAFCRSAHLLSARAARCCLLQARGAFAHTCRFLSTFDGDFEEIKEIASAANRLANALEEFSPHASPNELMSGQPQGSRPRTDFSSPARTDFSSPEGGVWLHLD